jgi:hypothetical protein
MAKRKVPQIPYRDKEDVLAALEAQARLRGRTISQELRLAVRLWLREAQLAQLADPVGRKEAAAQGDDVDADEKMLREQIKNLKKQAFAVPDSPRLMDVIREADGVDEAVEVTT